LEEFGMGASAWSYFTQWQKDVERADDELRDEVFRSGKFDGVDGAPRSWGEDSSIGLEALGIRPLPPRPVRPKGWRPATIKEATSHMGLDGTHSILDAFGIAATEAFGRVFPAPEEWLMRLYGTKRPTRKQVEALGIPGEVLEWRMVYFAVWDEGRGAEAEPTWWYFQGHSGD
jgi:hypothetical protein